MINAFERRNRDVRAAARGAELLDEKIPGWANILHGKIRDGRFNMMTWDTCVVGSLELLDDGVVSLNGRSFNIQSEDVYHYGFVPTAAGSNGWENIQAAWEAEVERRRQP